MGIQLLKGLTGALTLKVDRRCHARLDAAVLPALVAVVKASELPLDLSPGAAIQLLRLAGRYDAYLQALSAFLVIPLPAWVTSSLDALRAVDQGVNVAQ